MTNSRIKIIVFNCMFLIIFLVSCSDNQQEDKKKIKELVVLTNNSPTTWYEGRDGPAGPEYELINSFAAYKKINVKFIVMENIGDVLTAIRAGKGDIAAAGLTRTDPRLKEGMIFGPVYQRVKQQVVCRRNNGKVPRNASELVAKKIKVVGGSSYVETLAGLKRNYPELSWDAQQDTDTAQLLRQVWLKKIDCTLADSNIVSINRRYYPELVVAFDVSDSQGLAWVLTKDSASLSVDLNAWFDSIQKNGELDVIREHYYGHVTVFDYVDMRKYANRIKSRLPAYRKYFEEVAGVEDLQWTLLAAQAYQESHWNPSARSPTGVRGLMMLTQNTAKSVGVKNRLDPAESIRGGAKYLRRMLKRIPETVKDKDKLWFALAAYNVGFGHLRDARTLAVRLGKNPDLWLDIKEVLPLLMQKKYYKTLRYGYARGTEPVRYVERIRNYFQVLENTFYYK